MHRGQSFCDIRVLLRLCNIHLVELLMFDCHTAENNFNLLTKYLDALYPDWRSKLQTIHLIARTP